MARVLFKTARGEPWEVGFYDLPRVGDEVTLRDVAETVIHTGKVTAIRHFAIPVDGLDRRARAEAIELDIE